MGYFFPWIMRNGLCFSYVPRSEKLGKFSVVLINLALQVKYLAFPSSEIHFSSESVIINHHYSILQLYI